jgi:hypothetical protein
MGLDEVFVAVLEDVGHERLEDLVVVGFELQHDSNSIAELVGEQNSEVVGNGDSFDEELDGGFQLFGVLLVGDGLSEERQNVGIGNV